MGEQLSDQQASDLANTSVGLATLSFIASSSILFSYYKFPSLRKFSFKLVCMLAISDIFIDIAYMFGRQEEENAACIAQAMLQQFAELSSVLWTAVIAYCLYFTIVKQEPRGLEEKMNTFIFICWVVPFILMFLPLSTDSYGDSGAWCWIKSTTEREADAGTLWRFMLFYCPLWVVIIGNMYVYYQVWVTIQRVTLVSGDEAGSELTKLINRLKWYPMILILTWVWGTINRIHSSIHPEQEVFWLFCMAAIFRGIYGILNAMAYGMNIQVREQWVKEYPFLQPLFFPACCNNTDGNGGSSSNLTSHANKHNFRELDDEEGGQLVNQEDLRRENPAESYMGELEMSPEGENIHIDIS